MGTKSGVSVTPQTALEVSTVLACIKVIAEDIANLPRSIVQVTIDSEGREAQKPDYKHPVHKILTRKPNEWQSPGEFVEFIVAQACMVGDGYAFVSRDNSGRPMELLPLFKDQVTVQQNKNFDVTYKVVDIEGGILGEYGQKDILHLRGLMLDRIVGANTVALLKEAIGLSIALEETQSSLFKNGGHPGAIMWKKDGMGSDEARERIKDGLKKISSSQGRFGLGVLDGDWVYQQLKISAVDLQHIETRNKQVVEICGGFRMSPQMIGHTDKTATYASAEAFFSAHRVFTLGSWIRRFKELVDRVLLDDDSLRLHMDEGIFLRGSMKDQALYDRTQAELGTRTRNELRARDGKNPLPGLDEPLTPMNMSGNQDADETENGEAIS